MQKEKATKGKEEKESYGSKLGSNADEVVKSAKQDEKPTKL